jgi:hypothetical protein
MHLFGYFDPKKNNVVHKKSNQYQMLIDITIVE